jgi:hypothetical protein
MRAAADDAYPARDSSNAWSVMVCAASHHHRLFFSFCRRIHTHTLSHHLFPPPVGFVEEMRFVAMKLHTKDQAPKEGEREAAANSWAEVR